ncbi:radical SAM protein [Chloroflexota bacterium]
MSNPNNLDVAMRQESPEYVRISTAAAMTLRFVPGNFFRGAKLYCLNLLLNYDKGCAARCAYCGLQKARQLDGQWREHSFIRVDWPVVNLNELIQRMDNESCSHVERVCVSMVTIGRAREDTLEIVRRIRRKTDAISGLISPTVINKEWLVELKRAGVDKIGVAVDAATPLLFDNLRGKGVGGPHKWDKYWRTVEESVEVFGRYEVGIHLIVGLDETEEDAIKTIQQAYNMGALTHLFSFFSEEGSLMQDQPQPPVGKYRRVQLARYLINKGMITVNKITFDNEGRVTGFGIDKDVCDKIIDTGLPFMTSGCAGKTLENACNRPFSNCTPYQAYIGELRNYPFIPAEEDIKIIRKQLWDYSYISTRIWVEDLELEDPLILPKV